MAKKVSKPRARRTDAPRPGRKLETLVAALEGALCPLGVKVTSPDQIPDVDTGELREVDVSLRFRMGSTAFLVIVECRDRGRAQDVRWVEELSGKARSVGANKVIAVSSNGFTAAAIKKAAREKMDLRVLGPLDAASIRRWIPFESLALTLRSMKASQWRILVTTDPTGAAPDGPVGEVPVVDVGDDSQALLRLVGTKNQFSLADVFQTLKARLDAAVEERLPSQEVLPVSGAGTVGESPPIPVGLEIDIPDLELVTDAGGLRVRKIELAVDVVTRFEVMQFGDGHAYSSPDTSDVHAARFDVEHGAQGILSKPVELLVFPAEERFSLATRDQEGRVVEICGGATRSSSFPSSSTTKRTTSEPEEG